MENGGLRAGPAINLQRPNDAIAAAIGRDAGSGRGKAKSARTLRHGSGWVKHAARKSVGLEMIACAQHINGIIEESRRVVTLTRSIGNGLDNLAVAGGIEVAHVVAVHQVNRAALAAAHDQMRVVGAADRVWQQHVSARGHIEVGAV